MRVDLNAKQPAFQANVDERFVNALRGFINNGENRLKNNYKLNAKIDEFQKLGYDNYTIKLDKKYTASGTQYFMKAVDKDKEVVLAVRYSFRKIVDNFLNYTKEEFGKKMRKA